MAIIIERTITIKNDQATLDSPIYLYRGDGDIVCLFTIKEMKKAATFGKIEANNPVSQASYGNVRIYKPDGSKCVFTEKSEVIDDKLQVVFSYENIDQFTEVGVHKLQIHLYDDNDAHNESNDKNRFTLPPIDINVLLPVGDDNTLINGAVVGYALLNVVDEEVETFLPDDSYNKTEWENGDIITKNKMNKIEDALYQINDNIGDTVSEEQLNTVASNAKAYTNSEVAKVSSAVSKLNNTISGMNLTGYATKDYVDNAIETIELTPGPQGPAGPQGPQGPAGEGANVDLTDYATKNYVSTEIAKAQLSGGGSGDGSGVDLSGFATKDYVNDYVDDAIENIDISNVDLITQADLGNALTYYATKDYVQIEIAEAQLGGGSDGSSVDLSVFATKDYVAQEIAEAQLGGDGEGGSVDLSIYVTKNHADETYAEIGHSHLLSDLPASLVTQSDLSDTLANYTTKEQVQNIVNNLDNYITITNITDYLTPIQNSIPTKVSQLTNDACYVSLNTLENDYVSNYDLEQELTALESNIESNIPTNISQLTNDSGYITSNVVTRVEVVDTLPPKEETGVLYIVKA